MLLFNLWVKVDAHKIVKDYAYVLSQLSLYFLAERGELMSCKFGFVGEIGGIGVMHSFYLYKI